MPGLSVASDEPVRFFSVRETLTVLPALLIFGVNAVIIEVQTPVLSVMESSLPTASYIHIQTLPCPSIAYERRSKLS